MDLVVDFTIENIFKIPNKGVAVTGALRNDEKHSFEIGMSVKIIRPDGTTIISLIREIENFQTISGIKGVGLLLGETITKEDVPRGSKISIVE